jgi:hypothetical protein
VLKFASLYSQWSSVKYTALISGDHILNIDESILSTVDLEHFKGLLDEVTQVKALSLAVVDLVAQVLIPDLE